jgi:DNA invertase Pin-like site-specific DNA recombinase
MASPKIHPPTFTTQPGRTRAAIYARVSTSNNGQDPTMQTREMEEFCDRRGWELAGSYIDNGISGSKESRPELDRLMADAHRRRFDTVIVWKFDRFARSVSHLLRALETFKALGIDFVSLSEQVDTSTPTGKMVFTVLGAVAELERSLIAERVRAGIRNARAKGKRLGRPRVGVDPAMIAALRSQGHSWGAIHRETGINQGDGPAGLLQPASDRCTFDALILRKRTRRCSHPWLAGEPTVAGVQSCRFVFRQNCAFALSPPNSRSHERFDDKGQVIASWYGGFPDGDFGGVMDCTSMNRAPYCKLNGTY